MVVRDDQFGLVAMGNSVGHVSPGGNTSGYSSTLQTGLPSAPQTPSPGSAYGGGLSGKAVAMGHSPGGPAGHQDVSATAGMTTPPEAPLPGISGMGPLGTPLETPSRSPEPKPRRRKRECPQCHKLLSNLTTHRAIHDTGPKPYACKTCQRPFKRLNDLVRHERRHLSQGGQWQFECPFHKGSPTCHPTGHFSRCDTYKNHLRAIHFKYPPHTHKAERAGLRGNCGACGQSFVTAQAWLQDHVATGACPAIP